jgi:hypothetical protein
MGMFVSQQVALLPSTPLKKTNKFIISNHVPIDLFSASLLVSMANTWQRENQLSDNQK